MTKPFLSDKTVLKMAKRQPWFSKEQHRIKMKKDEISRLHELVSRSVLFFGGKCNLKNKFHFPSVKFESGLPFVFLEIIFQKYNDQNVEENSAF